MAVVRRIREGRVPNLVRVVEDRRIKAPRQNVDARRVTAADRPAQRPPPLLGRTPPHAVPHHVRAPRPGGPLHPQHHHAVHQARLDKEPVIEALAHLRGLAHLLQLQKRENQLDGLAVNLGRRHPWKGKRKSDGSERHHHHTRRPVAARCPYGPSPRTPTTRSRIGHGISSRGVCHRPAARSRPATHSRASSIPDYPASAPASVRHPVY